MRSRCAVVILALVTPASLSSQSLESLTLRFAGFTTVSGYEQAVTDSLLTLLPGATRDRLGNVTVTLGTGAPKRLAMCKLDEPGFVVGGITADGYLTLRRDSPATAGQFDRQIEGQRVNVFGVSGAVPGVVGVRSVHLTRGRASNQPPFTVDNAYVDVGAQSSVEVAALGIRLLSPVALARTPHRYGDGIAAPAAEAHAGCAALAAAVLSHPRVSGTVVVSFAVQTLTGFAGGDASTASILKVKGPFADLLVAATPVKYAGTAAETVTMSDVQKLEQLMLKWMGGGK